MMRKFFWPGFLILLAAMWPAFAGMNISPGTGTHTHADANTGGSTLLPATLNIGSSGTARNDVTSDGTNTGGYVVKYSGVNVARFAAGSAISGEFDYWTGSAWGAAFSWINNGSITVNGATAFSATVSSTKACASGYARTGPNYCAKTVSVNVLNLTAAACTQSTALTGVTDAKAVAIIATGTVTSNNGIAARSVSGNFYGTDNTCANLAGAFTWASYEFAATAAGTVIYKSSGGAIVQSNGNGQAYFNGSFIAGTGAAFNVNVIGYFD